jgi:hypothetical protein
MGEIVMGTSLIAGLTLGLAGSIHCLGMCGPLIMAMHGGQGKRGFKPIVLHHLGRALAYILLLTLFLLLGKTAQGMGWQRAISILGGTIFILGWIPKVQKTLGKFLFPLRNQLQKIAPSIPLHKNFFQGMMNGFLPCGWSISAIGAALLHGNVVNSILFILFFVMGNTPVLWLTAIGGSKITERWPWVRQKWARTSLLILGLIFILRGANLGIPYLSPKMNQEKMSCCETH